MNFYRLFFGLFLFTGCGYQLAEAPPEGDAGGEQEEAPEADPELPFECPDDREVLPGDNDTWNVDGLARSFYADFPMDMSAKVGVIFTWHGVGDSVANWRGLVAPDPNADPDFPFVVITPVSTQMSPVAEPAGIDWDIFLSGEGDDNREARLFETILGCLDTQFELDTRRIFTGGFSGGALVSAMLYSRYPDVVAAAAVLSGAFLNDPIQVESIDTGPVDVEIAWGDLLPDYKNPILMSRGGPNDTYGLAYGPLNIEVINFETTMQASQTYLGEAGRLMIDCPHTSGHYWPPGLTVSAVIDFFKAHPLGTEVLYEGNGIPLELSGICEILSAAE
ncbi:MAG: hypothetical protein CMH56_13200 [Myxococcales bacterium]|nr:hypothetical protein [Myxococcales bacterium]